MPDPLVCAYCRQRPTNDRWQPFCSERCRMADLGRWLRGDYRIAGEPAEVPDGEWDAFDAGPGRSDEP